MIPRISSVVELFQGHPERWTQTATARRADGTETEADDPQAVSFCIVGGCQRVYGIGKAAAAILKIRDFCGTATVAEYNNTHSFEDIFAVVKEAAV